MPIYEYDCPCGASVDKLRKFEERDEPVLCPDCGEPMERFFSAHHRQPDGIYSYCPNIGTEEAYERKLAGIKKREESKRN